jgi:hypothetical protein
MKMILRALAAIALLGAVAWLVRAGYQYPWTGFPERPQPTPTVIAAKTLWDWLQLLIVPIVLAIGGFLLQASSKRSDRAIESDRQKQKVLDDCFAYLSDLLLDGHLLGESSAVHARDLARSRILAALHLLDGRRKAQLLQFLYEARLIDHDPVLQLNGADFSDAWLDEATLAGAELRGVYFSRASIRNANLRKADLRGSDFSKADMSGSILEGTLFAQANFARAKLSAARLAGADFQDAYLSKARLRRAQRAVLDFNHSAEE